MNKIIHIWKGILGMLPLLCAMAMASCSFSDAYEDCTGGDATLQLNITAREESDLNTRADATEVGTDHEYMHNLCVLLVKDGIVVKKFLPDLSANAAAQEGNLKTWMSEQFTLETGSYTAYAFANIDSYFGTAWSSLTGIGEGENISTLNVENMVLDNPAGKLDLQTYYIPMSAREEITVTSATKSISIGLDRLVSKIRMTVSGRANTEINALSFGHYADEVPLFADGQLKGEGYSLVKEVIASGSNLPTDANGKLTVEDFYVNASPAGHPFQVVVTTNEKGGVTYQAQTTRDELPRNSIYPLTLQLNDYGLNLAANCWVSPIGSLPVEVQVGFEPDSYEIEVPEGCQFELTVNGVSGSQNVTDLSCTWNIPESVTGIEFEGATTGVQTVKGHVTAAQGKTFKLNVLVTWSDGAATYNRTYHVTLTTGDLTNFPLRSTTRSGQYVLDYLNPEMLNMFIKK